MPAESFADDKDMQFILGARRFAIVSYLFVGGAALLSIFWGGHGMLAVASTAVEGPRGEESFTLEGPVGADLRLQSPRCSSSLVVFS